MSDNNTPKKSSAIKQAVFTKETLGVVTMLFSALCLVCLITRDKVFSVPGELVNSFFFGCFGVFAFLVDVFLLVLGFKLVAGKKFKISKKNFLLLSFGLLSLSTLVQVIAMGNGYANYGEYVKASYLLATEGGIKTCTFGGFFTGVFAYPIYALFNVVGGAVITGIVTSVLGYFLIRNIVYQNTPAVSKNGAPKFRSTYTAETTTVNNVNTGVEITGVKDYPIEGAVPPRAPNKNNTQKLFINNENDFAFLTRKEKTKDVSHIKIDTTEGGLNVSRSNNSFSKTYVESLQEKIAYVKTPANINVDDSNSNRYYNSGVSSTLPRNPVPSQPVATTETPKPQEETVKPIEETTSTSTETTSIPFIEHNGTDTDNDATTHARIFSERYAGVTESVGTDTTAEPDEIVRPFVERNTEETETTVSSTVIPNIVEETEETEDTETVVNSSVTEDTPVEILNVVEDDTFDDIDETEETPIEETTEEDTPPSSSVIREENVRKILFGDETTKNTETPPTTPSYTSRANADGNGIGSRFGGRMGRDIGVTPTPVEPTPEPKPEKPKPPINRKYFAPPLDLLETITPPVDAEKEDHEGRMEIIKQTLEDFRISVTPQSYVQGPSITRYEIMMPAGISVKKVLSYDDDLKMRLASRDGVRIEAPIPGKNLVGIEVANKVKITVGIKQVIEGMAGETFKPGSLMFAIGKDIVGKSISDNLAKGPHYLVAGATGSGKSVCLNVMIVSLIMRYSPEELRLILIDPKRVGFRCYEHLPHLMIDEIVTEPKKALAVLQWAYNEMERRYKVFEESPGVISDIDAYNKYVASDTVAKMPRIVVVVDELADLMETCKKDMESKIRAIAQKARAAGIHLVLATQRPSVDIITGTIKANLPSRIALKVMNFNDSQTILGEAGAEKLLGNGDMLYKNSSMPGYERYQGAWISDREINNVVSYVKEHNTAYYDDDLAEYLEKETKPKVEETAPTEDGEDSNETDIAFLRALCFAINMGTVAISQIQRRFQMGYARAGGMVDKMERFGFISGYEGSKARKVLITKEEFEERFGPMSNYN